jgi:hypothetical protein
MISKIQKWFYTIVNNHDHDKALSKSNQILLQRDLENCFTLADITTIKEVVKLCAQDFDPNDLITFILNINYRKQLIEYNIFNLPEQRYSTMQLRSMIINTGSYAICDAIKLHVDKNKRFYLMDFNGFEKRHSVELYYEIIIKQKTKILDKYTQLQ